MLSRFHLIPERNGWTDRRTDGRTELLYQYRASVCWRAIKNEKGQSSRTGRHNYSEHVMFCHALLSCVLSSLFNLILLVSHEPSAFGQSYTVPIPKGNCNLYGKALTVEDFRGIAISPVYCLKLRSIVYLIVTVNTLWQVTTNLVSNATQAVQRQFIYASFCSGLPVFFAVFIDSIVDKIKSSGLSCYVKWTCMRVFLYADDIILLAPSVNNSEFI